MFKLSSDYSAETSLPFFQYYRKKCNWKNVLLLFALLTVVKYVGMEVILGTWLHWTLMEKIGYQCLTATKWTSKENVSSLCCTHQSTQSKLYMSPGRRRRLKRDPFPLNLQLKSNLSCQNFAKQSWEKKWRKKVISEAFFK